MLHFPTNMSKRIYPKLKKVILANKNKCSQKIVDYHMVLRLVNQDQLWLLLFCVFIKLRKYDNYERVWD